MTSIRSLLSTRRRIAATTVAVLALGGAGASVAIAGAGDDGDAGASGPGADRAKAAALRVIPGGHANSVERDGENGATWEVEVRRPDGGTVDVRLDADYRLVVVEADSEGS
jgi:hypothetical protein